MDVPELHRRAVAAFGDTVARVPPDRWTAQTPCREWDVRALLNHVVSENLWTPHLMRGATIAEIGDRFDGDVLGPDPRQTWEAAAEAAVAAVGEPGAMERTVHLSFGDFPAAEYAMQLFADHLIHCWDLARGIGADERLDPKLVRACAAWYAEREELYRDGGVVGPRVEAPADADAQTRLLAGFGRSAR